MKNNDNAIDTFLKMGFKLTGNGKMEYQCLDGIHYFSIWQYKVGGSIGEVGYIHKTLDYYHPHSDTTIWDVGVNTNNVESVLSCFSTVSFNDVQIMRDNERNM